MEAVTEKGAGSREEVERKRAAGEKGREGRGDAIFD
jgi:hypothetical protein